jgi:hypothetical protein
VLTYHVKLLLKQKNARSVSVSIRSSEIEVIQREAKLFLMESEAAMETRFRV